MPDDETGIMRSKILPTGYITYEMCESYNTLM